MRCDVGHYDIKGCILAVAEVLNPNVRRTLRGTIWDEIFDLGFHFGSATVSMFKDHITNFIVTVR